MLQIIVNGASDCVTGKAPASTCPPQECPTQKEDQSEMAIQMNLEGAFIHTIKWISPISTVFGVKIRLLTYFHSHLQIWCASLHKYRELLNDKHDGAKEVAIQRDD